MPVHPGLNRVYVRLPGAGDAITVRAQTAALSVCLASGPVGYLAPRSPCGPPAARRCAKVVRMSNLRDEGCKFSGRCCRACCPTICPTRRSSFGGGFAPELMEIGIEGIFGRLWSREGLSRRDRSLVTLGILIALGAEQELESHFRIAKQNGLTEDELAEVVYHASGYAGFPAANTAKAAAAEGARARITNFEPPRGIEPPTFSLRVRRSTD